MSETKFRLLVVLQFVVSIAAVATAFLPADYSQELEAAYAAEPVTLLVDGGWLSIVVVGLFLVAWLASQVGLVLFKRWGRTLSLYFTLAEFVFTPFQGPTLSSALESALLDTSMLLWGAILALAYFSAVSNRFGREQIIKADPTSTDGTVQL